MIRNTASQKWRIYAWNTTTGAPVTGDAANITGRIQIDDGASAATNDTNPSEVSSTNQKGFYDFDLTQAETNGVKLSLAATSTTSNIACMACPPVIWTSPANRSLQSIDSDGRLDISKVAGSATPITNFVTVYSTDFANNYDTTGDCWLVRLDNGVAHGGSTATIEFGSSTGNAFKIAGSYTGGTAAQNAAILFSHSGNNCDIIYFSGNDNTTSLNESGNFTGTVLLGNDAVNSNSIAASGLAEIATILATVTGTADSGTTTTIVDAERTEADTDYWKDAVVEPTSGANVGIKRRISAFNALTDTITVDEAWPNTIATGVTYRIISTSMQLSPAASSLTAAQVRQEMDDNSTKLADIVADTNELQTDWANDGRLDLILDAAASAGDPWITVLSDGGYTEGMAGYIFLNNLDAAVSSRVAADSAEAEQVYTASSSSIVRICNIALTMIGEPTITSLAESTKAARICDLRFGDARDAVLRCHPWNSAAARVSLSALAEAPAYGYTYQFTLPSDFVRVISAEQPQTDWTIEGNTILANITPFKMRYVARGSVADLDELLQQAIAARLAYELCIAITRNHERAQQLLKVYEMKLAEARHANASESGDRRLRTETWNDARYSGPDGVGYRRIEAT